ncbi:hypothetical protein Tco_0425642 [Tanacetum coccineum]
MQEVVLFYNGLDVPTRKILDSRGVIPSNTAAEAKTTIQEMAGYSQKWHNGTSRDVNNAKDPITPKIAHSKRKEKLLKKLTTRNLVDLFKEGDIEQQLQGTIKGTTQILRTKSEADVSPICRIGSSQYDVSIGQYSILMYDERQMTVPFPSRLNSYYCEEKNGSYGPQFSEAYFEASHINNSIPRKEKDSGSFTLPCFINNICFDNAIVDLGASVRIYQKSQENRQKRANTGTFGVFIIPLINSKPPL